VEVVASLSQGRRAAAQCGLFTYKSVPVIFEPPCITTPILSTTGSQSALEIRQSWVGSLEGLMMTLRSGYM